ncbi:MAG: T9SS type A sorting domain-containing protein [Bacteroidales bacterium]|nr:T9SS type A sorting domain-containing protein [Bacteroidales bacterium]
MRKIYVFTIFAALLPQLLEAQQAWNRIVNLPQENAINDIARIPGTEIIVAVGEGSTVMISENLGESWDVNCNPAGLNNFAILKSVIFTDALLGFITTADGQILRTTDGGSQWSVVHTTSPESSLNDIHFFNANHGIVCGDNGLILKTGNGGDDWITLFSGVSSHLKEIRFVTDQKGVILTSSTDYLLTTIDGGNTWATPAFNPPLEITQMLSFDFVNETTGYLYGNHSDMMGMIYKTVDGGNTWQLSFQADAMYTGKIAFSDPQMGMVLYGSHMYESKIYYTLDGGSNWTPATLPEYSMWTDRALFFYDPVTAFAAGSKGLIFRTEDHGISWSPLYEKVFKGSIVQVQFINESTGYITFLNELFGVIFWEIHKTIDGGVTWQAVSSIELFEFPPAFHFPDESHGYIVSGWSIATLWKTDDGGSTWETVGIADSFTPMEVKFFSSQMGFVAGQNKVYKTINAGENWQNVYTGSDNYFRILYQSADDIIIIGEYSLILSDDGGLSWTERGISNATPVTDAFMKDDGKIFIAFGEAIYWSDHQGINWNQAALNNSNPVEFRSIFFSSPDVGYTAGSGHYETMLKTIDGGFTWNAIEVPATTTLTGIWFQNNLHGFVFGEKGLALETFTGGVVGIEEIVRTNEIFPGFIYPNPFSDNFTIDVGDAWNGQPVILEVYDPAGRLIIQRSITSQQQQITFAAPGKGLYFYRLLNENRSGKMKKLIRQ